MPLQFDDAAQHAATLPNLHDRLAAFFAAIRSRLTQVDGNDSKAQLLKDFDEHHDLMVRTVVGDGSQAAVTYRGRLGPGETPYMRGDVAVSAEDSERHSNPTAPRDASGHKVHPSDAASLAGATDPKRGQGFGGNGMSAGADVRNQASFAASDAPTRSLQEERDGPFITDSMGFSGDKKLVPVIHNEIVAGSEVTRDGVRYVTKKRADGSTYEVVDRRPQNEPV